MVPGDGRSFRPALASGVPAKVGEQGVVVVDGARGEVSSGAKKIGDEFGQG